MSFIGGYGSTTPAANRYATTPGRIHGSPTKGVNYPSPFFDIAHTYLPHTVKQMFRWCRYYFLTNPLINATVFKLSEYPITDIVIDHEDPKVVERWTEYFQEHLNYRPFQIECGLDYHCFHGDVKAVTEDGVFRLRDLVGQTVNVLSQDGTYRPAKFIESITQQELLEVEFSDGSTVLTTPEHQWPTITSSGNIKKVSTTELEGRFVPRNVAPRPEQNKDFYEGVRHGFVFGDGTSYNDGKQARACFFGSKDKHMLRYFEGHGSPPYEESRGHIFIHGLPVRYKQALPDNNASASYWYGFLCGFLAADGSVDVAGCVVLTQRSRATLEAIAAQLPRLGMIGGKIRGYQESTAYGEGTTYVLSLFKQYMLPKDFLLPHHRSNFEENYKPTNYGKRLQVRGVRETGIFEKVFCCLEDETHTFTIDNGILTGNTYGNCMVSLGFPFRKYITCASCGFSEQAQKIRSRWTFTNYTFRLQCPSCGVTSDAHAEDKYFKNASGIKLVRWNCENVEVTYNDVTGQSTYFYNIPKGVRNDIVIGKKDVVETVPQVFIQALRQQKGVVFSQDNFFHLKRPTLAENSRGWGIPLILPVLKDTFYLQIMKKAQEAILVEHIVPLRILFPQAGSGSSDPYCVSPSTLVETIDGVKPAEEIRPGDYLRSHTGAWRRVLYEKRRKVESGEKVFKFKVASMEAFPFEVSEEHPILAVPRKNRGRQQFVDPEFIQARELKKGDYVAYPIAKSVNQVHYLDLAQYNPERAATEEYIYRRLSQGTAEIYEWLETNNDPKFEWGERKKFLEERGWSEQDFATAASMRREDGIDRVERYRRLDSSLATLVGWYLAEGSKKGAQVSFCLNENERDVAERLGFLSDLLGFGGVSIHHRPDQHALQVDLEDVLLSGLLMNWCGVGFMEKRIPEEFETAEALTAALLEGLFRGDGSSIDTSTRRVSLKSANPNLILGARRLLLKKGLIGCTVKEEPTEKTLFKSTSYQLNYNGKAVDLLDRILESGGTCIPPQQKVGLIRGDYVLLRIDDVSEVEEPEVIGFQMVEDKSFCVPACATHNTTINLVDWRDQIASEIARWRHDNNYIPILPLPIGNQTLGGDGRALLLSQEIQQWSEHIMVGMGVPREFLLGGMSYAGTNVSMRMLENQFLGFILRHKAMATWVMRLVASYMEWPEVSIRFKPFKMADDLQRKAYLFQLNQAQKISDTTLLHDTDLNQEEEDEIMVRETDKRLQSTKKQQLAMAEVQAESQIIMAKAQVKAQQVMAQAQMSPQAPGEPGGPEAGGGTPGGQQPGLDMMGSQLNMGQDLGAQPGQEEAPVDLETLAQSYAQQIASLPPEDQQIAMQNLMSMSPELAQLVLQYMKQLQPQQPAGAQSGVDMRPLPEQLPARREAQLV